MEIKSENLNPRPTDKLFEDSPDCGHPDCICSRCGSRIQEYEMPIRLTTTNEKGEVDKDSKEYRFCEFCTTGVKYFFCDSEAETFYRCQQQCDNCKKQNPLWVK